MPRWNSLVSLFVRSKPYLALLLWAGVPLLVSSEQHSLMGHDEGWYAQQARWIVESGDWVTQQWWGEPIYDRAMGIQWAIALAYTLFGISDRVARLPGVLACFAAILLLYDIARRCVPERIAWFSAAILAATPIWMQAGRLATQDVPLTAIELLGMWALVRAESHPECQAGWRWLAGTTFGLGFAVKSFMVVLAGVALLPYLVGERGRHRHLRSPALCVGLVMGFIPVAIWLGLSCDRYGTLPLENLFGLLFQLSRDDFHDAGGLYYFWNIPANAFPWPVVAIPGVLIAWRETKYRRKWLWLGFPLTLFLLLCLFETKTWYYPLQLMPFASAIAAVSLCHLTELYRRSHWLPSALSVALGAIACALVLTGGAIAFHVAPLDLDPTYGWVGIGTGLGWLIPGAICWGDRRRVSVRRRARVWQWGWLLGPWGGIVMLYATGLWGNYNPAIETALAQPTLAPILQTHAVDFVFADDDPLGGASDAIVLTFYTPQLGDRLTQLNQLQPGRYAWVRSNLNPPDFPDTRVVARIPSWQLVHRPERSNR